MSWEGGTRCSGSSEVSTISVVQMERWHTMLISPCHEVQVRERDQRGGAEVMVRKQGGCRGCRWSTCYRDWGMGSYIHTAHHVFEIMAERNKLVNFGKIFNGGGAQIIWSLPVALVCRMASVCWNSKYEWSCFWYFIATLAIYSEWYERNQPKWPTWKLFTFMCSLRMCKKIERFGL